MNSARPVQIPTNPQPRAKEIQISGRKPSTAASQVVVRR
jgi:hypothetical protein